MSGFPRFRLPRSFATFGASDSLVDAAERYGSKDSKTTGNRFGRDSPEIRGSRDPPEGQEDIGRGQCLSRARS